MFPQIITIFFFVAVLIQFIFIFYFGKCFRNYTPPKEYDQALSYTKAPVSIIICAKNEAENLGKNLEKVLRQDYISSGKPLFEVIVVNDHSEDNTVAILSDLQKHYTHLVLVDLASQEPHGKKYALAKGVAAARYECLLFTDADCAPAIGSWISLMTLPLLMGKEIVSGYGAYISQNTFLNKFIRSETVHTCMQYYAYNHIGLPYMAVGRNMACTKEIFNKASSSPLYHSLPYGDDDLLVSICATGTNMEIVLHPESFTYSEAPATRRRWIRQKQRHLSTAKYYQAIKKILLGAYAFSHALSWLLFIILLLYPAHMSLWIVPIMLLRVVGLHIALTDTAKCLNEKKLYWSFFIFDFGWMIYNFMFAPYIFWKNKKQWK